MKYATKPPICKATRLRNSYVLDIYKLLLQKYRIYVNQQGGGGGGGGHTVSHCWYLHSPLQMLSPENGVCSYLALEKIYGMSILRIRAFSPREL